MEALERYDLTPIETHPDLCETRKYHPIWQKAFKGLTYHVEQLITQGDMAATRFTTHGTHIGPFFGAGPTWIGHSH